MSDPVSLLMFAVVLALAGILFRWRPRQVCPPETLRETAKNEAAWFWFPGLLLTLLGGDIAFTWPLSSTALASGGFSGNANIVIGWPAFFFGLVILLSWIILLFRPESLRGMCHIAAFGGVMLLVLGVAILGSHIGQPPATDPVVVQRLANPAVWAILYWLIGLAACISPLALTRPRWFLLGKGLLVLPLVVFSLFTILTLLAHVQIPHVLS